MAVRFIAELQEKGIIPDLKPSQIVELSSAAAVSEKPPARQSGRRTAIETPKARKPAVRFEQARVSELTD